MRPCPRGAPDPQTHSETAWDALLVRVQASLRDAALRVGTYPALETPGYCQWSLWDRSPMKQQTTKPSAVLSEVEKAQARGKATRENEPSPGGRDKNYIYPDSGLSRLPMPQVVGCILWPLRGCVRADAAVTASLFRLLSRALCSVNVSLLAQSVTWGHRRSQRI